MAFLFFKTFSFPLVLGRIQVKMRYLSEDEFKRWEDHNFNELSFGCTVYYDGGVVLAVYGFPLIIQPIVCFHFPSIRYNCRDSILGVVFFKEFFIFVHLVVCVNAKFSGQSFKILKKGATCSLIILQSITLGIISFFM